MKRHDVYFRHLPKSLQRIPRVSALELTVYRNTEKDTRELLALLVPGRSKVYDVFVDRTTYEVHCTCVASSYGVICRHAIAVTEWCNGNLEKETQHTMSILDGAVKEPRNTEFKKTVINSARGEYKSFFLGIGSEIVKEHSNDACGICKGAKEKNGSPCRACSATGMRGAKEMVALRYALSKSVIEEEWVQRIISPPQKTQNGTSRPSTLWNRLSSLSGLKEPAEIKAWYDGLPTRQAPDGSESIVPIPCTVLIGGKESNPHEMRIAEVFPRSGKAAAPPPPPVDELDDGDEIPF